MERRGHPDPHNCQNPSSNEVCKPQRGYLKLEDWYTLNRLENQESERVHSAHRRSWVLTKSRRKRCGEARSIIGTVELKSYIPNLNGLGFN